jgi:hypothetical protein
MPTVIATLHTPWNCAFSKLAYREGGIPTYAARDPGLWVCEREAGVRRPIAEHDCDGCPHWVMDEGDGVVE